jgi:4'-phosphopantetheinyl transferase
MLTGVRTLPATLWEVDLDQPPQIVDAISPLLTAAERRASGREAPGVLRRRLLARAGLRMVLSRELGCSPSAVPLTTGRNGKPILTGGSEEIHFNLSRSGDRCLIAVSRSGPVGIDLERVAALEGLERIVETRFAPAEAAAILALGGDERRRAFYTCWTRKEAILKARGLGLDQLDQVVVSIGAEVPRIVSLSGDDPGAWALTPVEAGPDFVASLACRIGA